MLRRQPLKVRLRRFSRSLFHRLKRPRRVTCLDCGYLSFGEAEATVEDRVMLAHRVGELAETNAYMSPSISLDDLRCFRACWIDYAVYARNDYSILRELEMDRRGCKDFDRHRRGFKPYEHRDLLLKRWETRRQFFFTVVGSAVGSALALLVAWLTWRFGIK